MKETQCRKDRMRIALLNQKGGVGKTSVAVNLAYGLALEGTDTLLLDTQSRHSDGERHLHGGRGYYSRDIRAICPGRDGGPAGVDRDHPGRIGDAMGHPAQPPLTPGTVRRWHMWTTRSPTSRGT